MQYEVHFDTLPQELWRSVAGFLSQDSLRSMCLVSKSFCSLMQPELFWHYEQPGQPDEECSLRPFMRICLARPNLAAAVRKATVHDIYPVRDNDKTHGPARRKTKPSEWKRKYDLELQRLSSEAWPPPSNVNTDPYMARDLALLCSLIPNVEHLILDLPPTPFTIVPVLDHARLGWKLLRPALSQLRHLQVDFTFEKDGVELQDLGPFIALSSLKILQGHHVTGESDSDDIPENERSFPMPQQLSVEHIDLMCSVMTHSRLKQLIEGCRILRTFQIVYGEVLVDAVYEYDFHILSNAFLTHKASLERLTLDFEADTATELLEDDDITGVMAMSSFECLRHIDLPAWALLRADKNGDGNGNFESKSVAKLLPRSLETLVIRCCTKDIVTPLWGLFSSLDTFPNLKEIAFSGEFGDNVEGLGGFEDACKQKGIGLNKKT